MLAPTMMSRYSVGKSDVWISGTLALALVKGKDPKAIKLFFLPNKQMFFGQKHFLSQFQFVFKMEN